VRSLIARPAFLGAVVAQFLYVAAQAGIFSFFINYLVAEAPAISQGIAGNWLLQGVTVLHDGAYYFSDQGTRRLQGAVAFALFCIGGFTGAAILRKVAAHKLLGLYAGINAVLCALVTLKLGWISVAAVFLSFFFMPIMFPTIFSLGIRGLGSSTKKASSFIAMAIMGGAVMPKLMGYLGDVYNVSAGFVVPTICFMLIATYGYLWPWLSGVNPPSERR
jgi:FHS family L-fucose permease-like MFS transporter